MWGLNFQTKNQTHTPWTALGKSQEKKHLDGLWEVYSGEALLHSQSSPVSAPLCMASDPSF